ncbi:patatin-like phospholipase family protein [Halochromatium sp.]
MATEADAMNEKLRADQEQTAIADLLNAGFFSTVSKADLKALKPAPTILQLKAGETLVKQGDRCSAYYLLLRGRLRRFTYDDRGRRLLGEILPGNGVGASSLLSGHAEYRSTLRAVQDCKLVRFPRATFFQMMVLSWEFAINITREQIDLVRKLTQPVLHAEITSIAVLPIADDIDQSAFADLLRQSIAPIRSVSVIDENTLDEHLSRRWSSPALQHAKHLDEGSAYLSALGHRYDLVIYLLPKDAARSTQLFLGHADLVLLLTRIGAPTEQTAVERRFLAPMDAELAPRTDLVMLHPGTKEWTIPSATRSWLERRETAEWHHVRHNNVDDYQRLARVVTGNAVSLVLGGGGARTFAYIGAIKALQETGIPIDRVAGTSMGAAVAAFLALPMSTDEITTRLYQTLRAGSAARDYTLPFLSLTHGKKLQQATRNTFGDLQIEDLPIPFLCVSSNLSSCRPFIHDRGVLWRAVHSTCALPGISPPMFEDGRVLVDGAVVNNLPVDIVAERYPGKRICIDIAIQDDFHVPKEYDAALPSGWQLLWSRLNPFKPTMNVPNIFDQRCPAPHHR